MAQLPQMQPLDENDLKLVRNVRPADWKNPEPASRYNLVVIGAGTAGLVTAAGAAGLGAKVALIEGHLFGGDCLNTGCVPSKAMIRAGRAAFEVKEAAAFGVTGCGSATVDFGAVMARMRRIRAGISVHDSVERFSRELGVDVFLGTGKFDGPDCVEVDGKRLRFKKAVICTGSRAAVPQIPGIEETGYLTNENVFGLAELPSRLLVVGGGPVGCELSQTFARMGSAVTVIEPGSHLLTREDADAARIVEQALVRDGVKLALNAKILKAEQRRAGKTLVVEQLGKSVELSGDVIIAGVGRTPNVEALNLESAGVAYDIRTGVKVNQQLQTTNARIYAAGDVCSPHKFTHTADAHARIVIENALFMGSRKASALVIPWCTYTDPEIAHVGMNEIEARDNSGSVVTLTVPFQDVDRALLDGEAEGFARVHLKRGSDTILGATIVARHAGEMISEVTLAMTAGLGLSDIARTIHPYPTQAEAIKKLADAYNKTRITPLIQKVLSVWLKWRRLT